MAKLNEQSVPAAFQPYLQPGEQIRYFAFGVKQPNMLLIVLLIACAVLPGIIAVSLLTKNYLIALTDRRFVVLRVPTAFFSVVGNLSKVSQVIEYPLNQLGSSRVMTSTGALFTHIRIDDRQKPFVAKFHRMAMKTNRDHSMAIAQALAAYQHGHGPELPSPSPSGYPAPQGYPAQPSYLAPQAYPDQTGYPAQPGYPAQQGYPAPPTHAVPPMHTPTPGHPGGAQPAPAPPGPPWNQGSGGSGHGHWGS